MKHMILIAAFGIIGLSAHAQSNRTYNTDIRTNRINQDNQNRIPPANTNINLNRGSSSAENGAGLNMNTTQQYQGNRQELRLGNPPDSRREYEIPYRTPVYDTSKNNGHCRGCGSGALTDPHPWK